MSNQFIIVTGENVSLNGWYAPKGKSGGWNCNRWGQDLSRIKIYKTEIDANNAIQRNKLNQGVFPARVIPLSAWGADYCPRCDNRLEEDADGDMVCADCLYIQVRK